MLINLVKSAQSGDKNAMLKLISQFKPLLKKYSYFLNTDDAIQDLTAFFIELLYKIPLSLLQDENEGKLITYIEKSVKRQYIYLSKKRNRSDREVIFSDLSEKQNYIVECELSDNTTYNEEILDLLKRTLGSKEYLIIYELFFTRRSVTELSELLGISRQAVNQTKKRALQRLKKELT